MNAPCAGLPKYPPIGPKLRRSPPAGRRREGVCRPDPLDRESETITIDTLVIE
jgi:hypothetical protein